MITLSSWITDRAVDSVRDLSLLARALVREAKADPRWPGGAGYAATRRYLLARHIQFVQRRLGQLPEDGSDWGLGRRAVFPETLLDALAELWSAYHTTGGPRSEGAPSLRDEPLDEEGMYGYHAR